jgi:integrase
MVEQPAVNRRVVGSSPTFGANFPQQNADSASSDTVSTQETPESEGRGLKFPKAVKHRGKQLATIYGKSKAYPQYRVAWSVQGKRRMKAFDRYGGEDGALKFAEDLVKELAKGSQTTALTPAQATAALAALERLDALRIATGKRLSLLGAASDLAEAVTRLGTHSLSDAVNGFLGNVASIKRKDLSEAIEELIAQDEPRTKSSHGERAQLSSEYSRIRAILLRRFAKAFTGTAVCDLTKAHLDRFMGGLGEFSAKYRNHHRTAIKQFLQWAVRKDYLSPTHRLDEAEQIRPEHANTADMLFYTSKEFRALLEAAEGPLLAMIAIGGLARLRTQELLRLDWSDVWRVPGHIEVTAGKSKTRQRRLVEVCPALSAWLEPFRSCQQGKLWPTYDNAFQIQFPEICTKAGIKRKKNGLRHAFCSFHYAMHSNENLTAAMAGNRIV